MGQTTQAAQNGNSPPTADKAKEGGPQTGRPPRRVSPGRDDMERAIAEEKGRNVFYSGTNGRLNVREGSKYPVLVRDPRNPHGMEAMHQPSIYILGEPVNVLVEAPFTSADGAVTMGVTVRRTMRFDLDAFFDKRAKSNNWTAEDKDAMIRRVRENPGWGRTIGTIDMVAQLEFGSPMIKRRGMAGTTPVERTAGLIA